MANETDPNKELTNEIHKALEQCREETIWDAIEQLEAISATISAPKDEKIRAIETTILSTFGPERFVKALQTSEKNLNQLGGLYRVCNLPSTSSPDDLRCVTT